MKVIIDIETDKLENPSTIHLIVLRDIEDETKVYTFINPLSSPKEFLEFIPKVSLWVGHNILGYDFPLLLKFNLLSSIPFDNCIDTLVISRLVNYKQKGGHSLDNWGSILGYPKVSISDFSILTDEIIERCTQDTLINLKVYKNLERHTLADHFQEAIRVEQKLHYLTTILHTNGFTFNLEGAIGIHKELEEEIGKLTKELTLLFPPKAKLIREIVPKETSKGVLSVVPFSYLKDENGVVDLTNYSPGAAFSRLEWIPFSPSSPKQVVERLNELGWKPTEKTKGHKKAEDEGKLDKIAHYRVYGWRICEENLDTLPKDAPEASRKLVRWLMLDARRGTLKEWFNAFHEPSRAIHGHFLSIGTWTHRMAHQGPNMGNVPSTSPKYTNPILKAEGGALGGRLRALWTVSGPNRKLIGTDADGIQMRIFAHYINESKLIKSLVEGNKDNETDIHSLHRRATGINSATREESKTFIYAFLLGAGIGKIAQIFGISRKSAKVLRENFYNFYPGLRRLKSEVIPVDAHRRYFIGLDGRRVIIPGETEGEREHATLAGYLQNGEKIIMARACIHWNSVLQYHKIPYWFRNFVHDEWQTETVDDPEIIKFISDTQRDSIIRQGIELKLNCPLAANVKVGDNWGQTH